MSIPRDGFEMIPGVFDPKECEQIIQEIGPVPNAGKRALLSNQHIADLARSPRVLDLIKPHCENEPFPVRAIGFDKSPSANWLVAWHQDLTIAVRERTDVDGFGPWSEKSGIPHVQPPAELLARMITVRIHLDDANEGNGALRVLPGSHNQGRLNAETIREMRTTIPEHLCAAKTGDVLLMRPMILHASIRSTVPAHRRILHIEFADVALPGGLKWNEAA